MTHNLQYTEIQAIVGGGIFTENFPTNFHTFSTRRILLPGESADRWREVTQAEREAIEAADAQWVRPPQSVIDEWNSYCDYHIIGRPRYNFGKYNEATGFFELGLGNYRLIDITYQEAVEIMSYATKLNLQDYASLFQNSELRTFLPNIREGNGTISFRHAFMGCKNLEILSFDFWWVNNLYETFRNCTKLRAINGLITASGKVNLYCAFTNCPSLEYVLLSSVADNVGFKDCPKLLLTSLRWLIDHAINTTAITITVHPSVYAKLTGDTDNEAAAALTSEELEAWQQVLADAADKNILFATA